MKVQVTPRLKQENHIATTSTNTGLKLCGSGEWLLEKHGTKTRRHLRIIAERGRMAWQKSAGYNWRALVEADISRFKRVIGNGLRSGGPVDAVMGWPPG